jgi:hypothetical protein
MTLLHNIDIDPKKYGLVDKEQESLFRTTQQV